MMAVTYVHTSGRAVTVSDESRTARLMEADKGWTRQVEKKPAGRRKKADTDDE